MKRIILFTVTVFALTMFYGCPDSKGKEEDPMLATGTLDSYVALIVDGIAEKDGQINVTISDQGERYMLTFTVYFSGNPIELNFPMKADYVRGAQMTQHANDYVTIKEGSHLTGHAMYVENITAGDTGWDVSLGNLHYFDIGQKPYCGSWGTIKNETGISTGSILFLDGTIFRKSTQESARLTIMLMPGHTGVEPGAPEMMNVTPGRAGKASPARFDIKLK